METSPVNLHTHTKREGVGWVELGQFAGMERRRDVRARDRATYRGECT